MSSGPTFRPVHCIAGFGGRNAGATGIGNKAGLWQATARVVNVLYALHATGETAIQPDAQPDAQRVRCMHSDRLI